jgi:hypothetical protein
MTNEKRNAGLEKIKTLTLRNADLDALINTCDISKSMVTVLKDIISENEKVIKEMIKITGNRYEFLYNFRSGGWNSEYAYTMEEAQEAAKARWEDKENLDVDYKTFRVSTPADHQNLMSMFY